MPGGNPTDLGGLVEDFLGESSSVGDTPATSSPTDSLLSGLADDASDGLRFGEKHPDFEHEISGALHAWCQTLAKTVKSVQVYDRNNRMLRQFMQRAHRQLTQITARVPELTLSVREDRFEFGKDAVHVNPDRTDGLPFTFYRNALRRLTFVDGMPIDELQKLLEAITTDFGAVEDAQDDLVAVLWRLQLPHFRYFAIDALSVTANVSSGADEHEKAEVARLQSEVDGLVAAIYGAASDEDDTIQNISITKEDLEALKITREEEASDMDLLDASTERTVVALPAEDVKRLEFEQRSEDDDLAERLLHRMIGELAGQVASSEYEAGLAMADDVADAVVAGGRWDRGCRIAVDLVEGAECDNEQIARVCRRIAEGQCSQNRIASVFAALDTSRKADASQIYDFLRALGPFVTSSLIRTLDTQHDAGRREELIKLILETGPPDPAVIREQMKLAKPAVILDLLALAERLPPDALAPIVVDALHDPYPRIRTTALHFLRRYHKGAAEDLLINAMGDAELEVRLEAHRLAAARMSQSALSTLKLLLLDDKLSDRKPKEIRTMTAAYASLAGVDALPLLGKLLSPPLLARRKSVEAQIAAAFSLAQVGTEDAMALIKKGRRSLSTRVREACRRAAQPGAGAANAAAFLQNDVQDLLVSFVGTEIDGPDHLREALETRRQDRLQKAAAVRETSSQVVPAGVADSTGDALALGAPGAFAAPGPPAEEASALTGDQSPVVAPAPDFAPEASAPDAALAASSPSPSPTVAPNVPPTDAPSAASSLEPDPSGMVVTPLPGGGLNSPAPLPGGGLNTPAPLPGGGLNSPAPLPGAGLNSPAPLPGGGLNTPAPLPGAGLNSPAPLPGAGLNTPAPLPGGGLNTPAPLPGGGLSPPAPLPGVGLNTPAPLPGVGLSSPAQSPGAGHTIPPSPPMAPSFSSPASMGPGAPVYPQHPTPVAVPARPIPPPPAPLPGQGPGVVPPAGYQSVPTPHNQTLPPGLRPPMVTPSGLPPPGYAAGIVSSRGSSPPGPLPSTPPPPLKGGDE